MELSARVAVDTQGFDIYKTADGEKWEVVTNNSFGDKFNYGALRFVTTEEGMYITTANPFYGTQLYLLSNDKKPPVEPAIGDLNGDDSIDVFDSLMIQKYASGVLELDEQQLALADINGDGSVDILDAMAIQELASGQTA